MGHLSHPPHLLMPLEPVLLDVGYNGTSRQRGKDFSSCESWVDSWAADVDMANYFSP